MESKNHVHGQKLLEQNDDFQLALSSHHDSDDNLSFDNASHSLTFLEA
jgi:hypothetical protein